MKGLSRPKGFPKISPDTQPLRLQVATTPIVRKRHSVGRWVVAGNWEMAPTHMHAIFSCS